MGPKLRKIAGGGGMASSRLDRIRLDRIRQEENTQNTEACEHAFRRGRIRRRLVIEQEPN